MAVTSTNNLRKGSSGSDVLDLQKKLNSTGNYNLAEDGIFGDKTLAAVKDYQQKKGLAVDGIVGTNTWGALTKANTTTTPTTTTGSATTQTAPADTKPSAFTYEAYKPSDAVAQAEALLQQQLAQKPGTYSSPWQAQLDDAINKILNREKFSYDLNGDALYQQYKDQYTTQGKMAMMDTMGQAQAMTGGYGNSYAQSVGQQAYQGYLQQLNDKVPELYQLALDQYNQEGQDLYNQYGLFADRDATEYGRHRDTVSDYYTDLDYLANDARYKAEDDYGKWSDKTNMDYGIHRDGVSDDQWNQTFQYQKDRDLVADDQWSQSFNYQKDRDLVADDQWQKTFDEGVRQFDKSFDESTRQFNASQTVSGGSNDPKYKSLDVGSTAYNTILTDIDAVEDIDGLYNLVERYISLGYDPDQVNAMTSAKASALQKKNSKTPKLPNGARPFTEIFSIN